MKLLIQIRHILFLSVYLSILVSCKNEAENKNSTWSVYRGDKGSSAYSSLSQINRTNVNKLKPVWTYNTGDSEAGMPIQCNPILANNMLYVTSPKLKVIALDPKTGKQIWRFDPFKDSAGGGVNRGVTYWEDGNDKRVFIVAGSYLFALDANNGNIKVFDKKNENYRPRKMNKMSNKSEKKNSDSDTDSDSVDPQSRIRMGSIIDENASRISSSKQPIRLWRPS